MTGRVNIYSARKRKEAEKLHITNRGDVYNSFSLQNPAMATIEAPTAENGMIYTKKNYKVTTEKIKKQKISIINFSAYRVQQLTDNTPLLSMPIFSL